jgi:hypothetical protein
MNHLKRLFGPRALASTVATGLAITSAFASGGSYLVLMDSGSGFTCPNHAYLVGLYFNH